MTSTRTVSLRTALGMMAGAAAVFFAGVYAANAGLPGGATKDTLAFAGTMTGATGAQTLSFVFKDAQLALCTVANVDVDVDATGRFVADLDISGCKGLFDGTDYTVEVLHGGAVVGAGGVSPVPYAKYADRVGLADCPAGYVRTGLAVPWNAESAVCVKGKDEVVRVGTGASAFWVDRYEASVWSTKDAAAGTQLFVNGVDDTLQGVQKSGQVVTPGLLDYAYALSVTGVDPGRSVTWFQAVEACAASGKRLIGRQEWFRAARGTADPPANNDGSLNEQCNTLASPRLTGQALSDALDPVQIQSCVSDWGAQDMIGNVSEWTDEWYAAVGDATVLDAAPPPWPTGTHMAYGGDDTWNIVASKTQNGSVPAAGLPAAALRGGSSNIGVAGGAFALYLANGPSTWGSFLGFRCVVPR